MATVLQTYDLKGNKLSYADWISNLSPSETPFGSMTRKESVDQTQYSWQTDYLSAPKTDAVDEGAAFSYTVPTTGLMGGTEVHTNFTQILRKIVNITDTTKRVSLYGRSSEVSYQIEKASKEMRRDLELMLLQNGVGNIGSANVASRFAGFEALCAAKDAECPDTGAKTHYEYKSAVQGAPMFDMNAIFAMTLELYKAGSKANKIMVHPKYMQIFSNAIAKTGATKPHIHRMFHGMDEMYNAFVTRIRDPLGQEFDVIPNRYMREDRVFFYNPEDWAQMVLREPTKTELAKTGSSEKWMLEMEVGLRHRNKFASGVLELVLNTDAGYEVAGGITGAAEKNVGEECELEIEVKTGASAVANASVTFVTDFGTLVDANPATTDAAGKAKMKITSATPGVARVYAIVGDGTDKEIRTPSVDVKFKPVVRSVSFDMAAAEVAAEQVSAPKRGRSKAQ